jgi:hypothetical protein
MNKLFLCFSICLIISFNSCKEAPTDTPLIETKITGKTTDAQTNEPLAGVQISTNPASSSVVTGNDGNYTISNITSGQYTITAKKSGYNDNTSIVTISEGKTVTADIQLFKQGPELEVSTLTLDFETALTNLTFTISNKTKVGTVTWQMTANKSWINLTPLNGTTTTESDVISVNVSRDSLNYGNYSGVINVQSDYGTKVINVICTKPNPSIPQLTINPTTLDFGPDKNNLELLIKNTGAGTLSWHASTNFSWILLSSTSGNTISGSQSSLIISVNKFGLEDNNYEGMVSISSNGGNQNIIIKMTVQGGSISPPTLQIVGTPSTSSIELAWTKISDPNFGSYKIFRSLAPGVTENSQLVTTITNPNQNSYKDENLNSATTYYYRIYVYDISNAGGGSNEVSATTAATLKNWILQAQFAGASFYGVSAVSDNQVTAVGEYNSYGVMANWDGVKWALNSFQDLVRIYDVVFLGTNEGYAIAKSLDSKIVLLKYNGISWTQISSSFYSGSQLKMAVVGSDNVYVVNSYNNYIYHYDNNGWSSTVLGSWHFSFIAGTGPNNVWAIDTQDDVYYFNGSGWGLDNNASQPPFSGITSLKVYENQLWVSTYGGVYVYNGSSWSKLNYSSNNAIRRINNFYLLNTGYGWFVGDYGKIYYYNGSYLTEKTSPVSSNLYNVFLLNTNSGWAVGSNGNILRYN